MSKHRWIAIEQVARDAKVPGKFHIPGRIGREQKKHAPTHIYMHRKTQFRLVIVGNSLALGNVSLATYLLFVSHFYLRTGTDRGTHFKQAHRKFTVNSKTRTRASLSSLQKGASGAACYNDWNNFVEEGTTFDSRSALPDRLRSVPKRLEMGRIDSD